MITPELGCTSGRFFDAEWNVRQWVEVWKGRDVTRGGGPLHLFLIMHADPGDKGTVDQYDVVVQGTARRLVQLKTALSSDGLPPGADWQH